MSFAEKRNGGLCYLSSSLIDADGCFKHAFSTRLGGVSEGMFESLNLGTRRGDKAESVLKNYDIICSELGLDVRNTVLSNQVHKDEIRLVTADDYGCGLFRPRDYEADALMTSLPNAVLVIFWADCVPVLICDPVKRAVAAVHAGWRGTVIDIVGKAVRRLSELYGSDPGDLICAIGPSIGACCFETDDDVAAAVRSLLGSGAERYIEGRDGKWMVDLKGVNSSLLQRTGVSGQRIDICPDCTACMTDKYWSHRLSGAGRGSQATIISILE